MYKFTVAEPKATLEKSGLKVNVKSGDNSIDFVLTSKSGEVKRK